MYLKQNIQLMHTNKIMDIVLVFMENKKKAANHSPISVQEETVGIATMLT